MAEADQTGTSLATEVSGTSQTPVSGNQPKEPEWIGKLEGFDEKERSRLRCKNDLEGWNEYRRKYNKKTKYRRWKTNWTRNNNHTNIQYAIKKRLRTVLKSALNHYTKTGKMMSSRKYGIDFDAIIKHLGNCPGDLRDYQIDHIIPLSAFDLTNPKQVGLSFSPINLRWMLKTDNLSKGKKITKEAIDVAKKLGITTLKDEDFVSLGDRL